jgi:NMD protein affecting ribosome stability and mRNA decay
MKGGEVKVGNDVCPKCFAAHPTDFDCTIETPSLSPGVGCEHTPGPWQTEPQGEGARGHWLHDGEEEYVALACRRVSRSEEEANARLIAAAPDMFDALERLLDQRKAGFFTEYAWEAARAALARAKGDRA